ncbi:MAG: hypothetical protein JXQ87_14400 [Bacteroidia bacterium]
MKYLLLTLTVATYAISAFGQKNQESPSIFNVIYGEWVLTEKYNINNERLEKLGDARCTTMYFEKVRKNWFSYLYSNNGVVCGQRLITTRDNFFSGFKGYNSWKYLSNTSNTVTIEARSESNGNKYKLTFSKQ